ncbi:MAG: EF-hand domain-containing protein [Bacteroidota bacterium]
MLTILQQIKHRYIFNVLDFDGNGYIEKEDFLAIAENLCLVRGEEVDTEDARLVMEQCMKLWEGLAYYIDENNDNQCSLQEWFGFIEEHLINPKNQEAVLFLNSTVSSIFDLYDVNGDGDITWEEYLDIFLSFRLNASLVGKSFRTLDVNNDKSLSKNELINAISDFLISDDINLPGNWIFGNLYDQAA